MPGDAASTARCISHCRGQHFTLSTSSRARLADHQSPKISLGLVPAAIYTNPIVWKFYSPTRTETVPLFNPRTHRWDEHFRWEGYYLTGLTPIGRATIRACCSIMSAESRFAGRNHCSSSFPRTMHSHSRKHARNPECGAVSTLARSRGQNLHPIVTSVAPSKRQTPADEAGASIVA